MTPQFLFSSVGKAVRKSYPFRIVHFSVHQWLFKIILCPLDGSCFVVELKIVSVADHYRALSSVSLLFLCGFLSLIASLRATGVDVLLYQYSQLVLLRHSNDRLASSCLVAVPIFKIISLAER